MWEFCPLDIKKVYHELFDDALGTLQCKAEAE